MNLLTPENMATIFSAFGDLADTFHRDALVFTRRARAAALFNDSRAAATTASEYPVRGMNVPDKKAADEEQGGTSDRTGGYVLLNGYDLRDAGLADAHGLPTLREGADTLRINDGPELRIDKAVGLGPLNGTMAVAKVYYSQEVAQVGPKR